MENGGALPSAPAAEQPRALRRCRGQRRRRHEAALAGCGNSCLCRCRRLRCQQPAPPVAPIVARDAAVATILACLGTPGLHPPGPARPMPSWNRRRTAGPRRIGCDWPSPRPATKPLVRQLRRSIELRPGGRDRGPPRRGGRPERPAGCSGGSSRNGSPAGCGNARKAKDGKPGRGEATERAALTLLDSKAERTGCASRELQKQMSS